MFAVEHSPYDTRRLANGIDDEGKLGVKKSLKVYFQACLG